MSSTRDTINRQFQEYLRIAYEGRWYIIIIFLIVVSSTWIYTLQQDDVYTTSASIRVKRQADIFSPNMNLINQDLGLMANRIVANEIQVIKSELVSRRAAETLLSSVKPDQGSYDTLPILKAMNRPSTLRKIFRSLKLENFMVNIGLARMDTSSSVATLDVITARINASISASVYRDIDFIQVICESTSPIEAAILTNLVVDSYTEVNLENARSALSTARSYLEGQRNEKKDSLRSAEQNVKDFQQMQGIVSLDAESKELISRLSTFEAEREQAKIEMEATQKILSEYRQQLKTLEPTIPGTLSSGLDPSLQRLILERVSLESQMSNIDYSKKEVLPTRPDMGDFFDTEMKKLRTQYDDVQKRIVDLTNKMIKSDDIMKTPLQEAKELKGRIITKEIEIESIKAKLLSFDKTISDYTRKFDALPEQSIQYARLERSRLSNEKLYSLLEQKFQETVINEKTTMGNAIVFDRASVPGKPTRPNRPMNMLMGVVVGLVLGFGVAILAKYLDTTIRNPEDVEKLGYSVLTFIPTFSKDQSMKRSESLIAYAAPQAPASEAYRTLRTSVENILTRNGKSIVIIITSPAPKEGKSTVVANLAVSSAISGRKVLLIDCDLRRPVQHSIFELDREPGLSDFLVGGISLTNAVRRTMIPGLHVMPAGHIPSHPAELLGTDRMPKLLDVLRQHYDFVLIDSPPIIAMADSLILARHTDGVSLVVSADSTKSLGLEKSTQILNANGARVLGVIVNRFNATKIYYSYYRYYYQNYYYYSEDGTKKKKSVSVASKRAAEDGTSAQT